MYALEIIDDHAAITLFEHGNPHKILLDFKTYFRINLENVKLSITFHPNNERLFVSVYSINGKRKSLSLAKWIMGSEGKVKITHKNSDVKDCRILNLIRTDNVGVQQNRVGAQKNTKTDIRGVTYDEKRNKYVVQVNLNNKRIFFKRYDTIEEAELEAIKARFEHLEYSFSDQQDLLKFSEPLSTFHHSFL